MYGDVNFQNHFIHLSRRNSNEFSVKYTQKEDKRHKFEGEDKYNPPLAAVYSDANGKYHSARIGVCLSEKDSVEGNYTWVFVQEGSDEAHTLPRRLEGYIDQAYNIII